MKNGNVFLSGFPDIGQTEPGLWGAFTTGSLNTGERSNVCDKLRSVRFVGRAFMSRSEPLHNDFLYIFIYLFFLHLGHI